MRAWVPGRVDDGVNARTTAPSAPGATPSASRASCRSPRSSPTISTGAASAVAAVSHDDAHLEPRGDGDDGAGHVEDGLPARGSPRGEEGEGEEAREAGQT